MEILLQYDWLGNIRELENVIERAINFLDFDSIIKPEHLPDYVRGKRSFNLSQRINIQYFRLRFKEQSGTTGKRPFCILLERCRF